MKKIKQTNTPENPTIMGEQRAERDKNGRFVKGHKILGGRPQGSKDFKTLMDEAVESIAKANNLPEGEVWQVLIKRGYSEAKDGNYLFYKDILDRYFGKPIEPIKHSGFIGFKPEPEEQENINKALNDL